MLQQECDVSQLKAKNIMTKDPKAIQSDALAAKGFALMRAHSISQLVVLDGEKYAGMVHVHDIMREGII
jgi:arabinose-5-phosphate isomerase